MCEGDDDDEDDTQGKKICDKEGLKIFPDRAFASNSSHFLQNSQLFSILLVFYIVGPLDCGAVDVHFASKLKLFPTTCRFLA